MPITHSTVVEVADDGTSPVGTDEWNGAHVISLVDTINFLVGNGVDVISLGIAGDLFVDYPCTVNAWKAICDTGTIKVDVWQAAYSNLPPTDANAMPGAGNEPTIASGAKGYGDATGWTNRAIANGSAVRFNVDACVGAKRATIALKVTRTA